MSCTKRVASGDEAAALTARTVLRTRLALGLVGGSQHWSEPRFINFLCKLPREDSKSGGTPGPWAITIVYRGYVGIMEKKIETTIVYWGYSGIMEKKMETTIVFILWKECAVQHLIASLTAFTCGPAAEVDPHAPN